MLMALKGKPACCFFEQLQSFHGNSLIDFMQSKAGMNDNVISNLCILKEQPPLLTKQMTTANGRPLLITSVRMP